MDLALLREFGFPVFVSVWFMWRLEKRVDRLFELMSSLMQATSLLAKSIDDHWLSQRHHLPQLPPAHQQLPAPQNQTPTDKGGA